MRRQKMKIHRLLASRDGRCKRLGAPHANRGQEENEGKKKEAGMDEQRAANFGRLK